MSGNTAQIIIYFLILIAFVLFAGTPDLHDAIIEMVRKGNFP